MKFVYAVAALCILGVWLYALVTIIYFPIRAWIMKYQSRDIWSFLSRRRLLLSAVMYIVSAPLLIAAAAGAYSVLVGGARASGPGAGGGGSDRDVDLLLLLGWIFLGVFLAAAAVAVIALFVRQRHARA